MGSGRKKKMFPRKEDSQRQGTINCSVSARNLRKSELGAVIFGCKNHTITECNSNQLFGLPYSHFSYVKDVAPGLPLFLFNYSDRMLHGIYEAASAGELNINPYGWIVNGEHRTQYPAQVRIRVREQCCALREEVFRPIIADNYYEESIFWFELDHSQTCNLIDLFLSSPSSKIAPPLHSTLSNVTLNSNGNNTRAVSEDAFSKQHKVDIGQVRCACPDKKMNPPALDELNNNLPHKSWSSLFKESVASDTAKNKNLKMDLNKLASTSWHIVECLNMESQMACVAPIQESQDQHLETCPDAGDVEGCERHAKDYEHCEAPRDLWVADEESCKDGGHFDGSLGSWDLEECGVPGDPSLGFMECSVPAKTTSSPFNAFQKKLQIMDPREKVGYPASVASDLHFRQSYELKTERERSCITNVSDGRSQLSDVSMASDEKDMCNDGGILEGCFEQPVHFVGPYVKEIESSVPFAVGEFKSSDIQSLVDKLIQEIGEMKGLQLKHDQKIISLETELVESKLEIQQMRNQLNMLSSRKTLSKSGHFEGIDFETFNSFPEFDDPILMVGGYNDSSWSSDLSLYSPSRDIIKPLTPMTFLHYYTSVAKLNDEIFLFGGVHGDVWYDTVESYNPRSKQWSIQPPLNKKRGSSAGISVLEKLFAIGGGDGVECFAEVEMLDLNIGKWIYTQPMKQKRFAPAVADINGALYVVGGYDGIDYLKSVERFDPREHKWTGMASIKMRRGCFSLVVLNGKLFALGGYDGEHMVSTVEVFDPRACSWVMGESMKIARGNFGAAVNGEKIFVIGGMKDNEQILDSVESYKEDGCGWRSNNSKVVGKRCLFSALAF